MRHQVPSAVSFLLAVNIWLTYAIYWISIHFVVNECCWYSLPLYALDWTLGIWRIQSSLPIASLISPVVNEQTAMRLIHTTDKPRMSWAAYHLPCCIYAVVKHLATTDGICVQLITLSCDKPEYSDWCNCSITWRSIESNIAFVQHSRTSSASFTPSVMTHTVGGPMWYVICL